ncbi:MAG: PIN domain-containing protein [Deltaproteobacteria bacterium]|nr:PIN domain-containing protein [Deltaproteobacteria bacterium]
MCIFALKQHERVLPRLLFESPRDMTVSVVSVGELRTGAAKSSAPARTLARVESFLKPLTVLDFVRDDASVYAELRARLERAGTPIGPLDTLIAAHALARKLTLVSNNEKEFRRVKGLRVENWAKP